MKTTDKTVKFVVDVENNFVKVLQFAVCITHCCVFLFSRLKVRCSVCNNNRLSLLSLIFTKGMEVIEILPDLGFSYALTEVKRRLICNILCKLFFFIGKELQRNCSLVFLIHHVLILSMLSPGSLSLSFPTPKLGSGKR